MHYSKGCGGRNSSEAGKAVVSCKSQEFCCNTIYIYICVNTYTSFVFVRWQEKGKCSPYSSLKLLNFFKVQKWY